MSNIKELLSMAIWGTARTSAGKRHLEDLTPTEALWEGPVLAQVHKGSDSKDVPSSATGVHGGNW